MAYVMQQDHLYGYLTVWETMEYAANFYLPETMDPKEKQDRIKKIVLQLGLWKCRHTLVGNDK